MLYSAEDIFVCTRCGQEFIRAILTIKFPNHAKNFSWRRSMIHRKDNHYIGHDVGSNMRARVPMVYLKPLKGGHSANERNVEIDPIGWPDGVIGPSMIKCWECDCSKRAIIFSRWTLVASFDDAMDSIHYGISINRMIYRAHCAEHKMNFDHKPDDLTFISEEEYLVYEVQDS